MQPIYLNHRPKVETLETFMKRFLKFPWQSVKDCRKELFMSTTPMEFQYEKDGHIYKSTKMNATVKALMDLLNDSTGYKFNVCFLNLYSDHLQYVDWHADDSDFIDQSHPIAVTSVGEEREIWWKEKGSKGEVPRENKQTLENGSIFIMPPGFQDKYFHKIPKHYRPCGPRISLTYRRYKQ